MTDCKIGRRILIVVENLPVPRDRRVWQEALSLTAAGYHVSVICPTGPRCEARYEAREGVHIYRYPAPPEAHSGAVAFAREYLLSLWHWFRLARVVRREQGFDVIQGCNPPDLIFLLALRYRLSGVRYLFDQHDVCPELYEAKFGRRGVLHGLLRLCERLTYACSDVVVATNDSVRARAIRAGVRPEDVFVVRSAPRLDRFRPGPGDARHRKGARTVLGYVGVIGQQEGMDLLIAALDHLRRDLGQDDIHLIVVGFGPHLEEVRADVRRRGLEDHVTFTGPLFDDDLLEVLNVIDIGVAPDPKNRMNDISTMNKVMEYMALGKPLVQFDLTEGRASAGAAALYARNNDPRDFAACLAELAADPERRARMGELGQARVRDHLSWDHSTRHLLAAYDRVFDRDLRTAPEKTHRLTVD